MYVLIVEAGSVHSKFDQRRNYLHTHPHIYADGDHWTDNQYFYPPNTLATTKLSRFHTHMDQGFVYSYELCTHNDDMMAT